MKNLIFLLLVLFTVASAQTFKVTGVVSTSTGPVKSALVVFINDQDSSQTYSAVTDTNGKYQLDLITSVNSNNSILPNKFELGQNYPNPFSTSTDIPYKLKIQSDVRVTIYDILGRVVRKFSVGAQTPGIHSIIWNGRNNFGASVAAGIYFYRLQVNGESFVKKMVLDEGVKNLLIPSPAASLGMNSGMQKSAEVNLQSGFYSVQINNASNTYPIIIPQQFYNIEIQSDTTLNFTVSTPSQEVVYIDSTQQIIRGFGAANIVQWRPDMTSAEIQTAFGNGPGQLGFTILRLRIPPDSTSFKLNVPTAKAAYSMGVKLIATPWTPPAWMKSNNSTIGGTLDTSAYAAYAAHLKAFADTMKNNGAPLYAISVQNEPDAHVGYESCFWDATQFLNFMKYYAPEVGVPVFMPESESFVHQLSDSTLNDSIAVSHVAFVGGHIYGTSPSSYPLALSKGKELWMTEYLINSGTSSITSIDTGWAGAILTAKSINDCMNADMSAYVWWFIVRYYGPITDGQDGSLAGSATKKGYVMSQFSKFIRPGYYKIKCSYLPQRNVYVTAYKDSLSSKVVIVALNMSSSTSYQTFSFQNGSMSSFTPYTTSETENVQQGSNLTVTNGSFTAALEPSRITTFVSN